MGIKTVSTTIVLPDAPSGGVNVTVPPGAIGPVSLVMALSARSLRVQLLEINAVAVAPAPPLVQASQQVVFFEEGEVVGPAHGYDCNHDGAGASDAVLTYREKA